MRFLKPFIIVSFCVLSSFLAFPHGDSHKRIAEINIALLEDPNNAMLYFKRACLYLDHNELTKALYDFDKSTELNPELLITYLRRTEVFYKLELYDEALKEVNHYLNSETEKMEYAYLYRARTFAKLKRIDKSVHNYKKVLETNIPELPEVYHELADVFLEVEPISYLNALECLQQGIEKFGDIQSFHSRIIELHILSGNNDAALVHLDEQITKMTRKETWYKRKADLLVKMNRISEAKSEYQLALNAISLLSMHRRNTEFVITLQKDIEQALSKLN